MNVYEFHRGTSPLLISIPHSGTELPEPLAHRLTVTGRGVPDTDWHVHLLYDFARELGASIIKANYSRYVVDLNRSPDSASLYVGNATSPVCPTQTFGGSFIYMTGQEPNDSEIAERIDQYWQPYHERIATELAALRAAHGKALLWDAHSIASEIPGLFEGVLPEFNLGTRDGASCPSAVGDALLQSVLRDGEFGVVLDGRFKGGYITDHYGKPADNVYAVQLELSRRAYMDEVPEQLWDAQRAERAQALIKRLLRRYLESSM
jgi:N-formylglutamate deformylase